MDCEGVRARKQESAAPLSVKTQLEQSGHFSSNTLFIFAARFPFDNGKYLDTQVEIVQQKPVRVQQVAGV